MPVETLSRAKSSVAQTGQPLTELRASPAALTGGKAPAPQDALEPAAPTLRPTQAGAGAGAASTPQLARPRTPTRVDQAALKQHPLVVHRQARADEARIGALAAADPRAQQAADGLLQLVQNFHTLLVEHGDPAAGPAPSLHEFIFSTGGSRSIPLTDAQLQDVLAHGNVREKLALADTAAAGIGTALFALAERADKDPAFAHRLQSTGLRLDVIQRKFQQNQNAERKLPYDAVVLNDASPLKKLPQLRQTVQLKVLDPADKTATKRVQKSVYTRGEAAFYRQSGRSLRNWDEHSSLPLSSREEAQLSQGLRAPAPGSGAPHGVPTGALPLTEGRFGKRAKADSDWAKQAAAAQMPLSAGISGTTYRLMSLFYDLGGDRGMSDNLRLACLGYLVPMHHSFHEVMSAAVEGGSSVYMPGEAARTTLLSDLEASAEAGAAGPVPASRRVAIFLKETESNNLAAERLAKLQPDL